MLHPLSILLPSANLGGYSARRWRACVVLAGITGLALAFGPVAANAFGPRPQPVPFVGCPGDGQIGPVDASETTGPAPWLAGDAASHLAYYAFRSVGVLAPRSWRCFGLYGSDADILFVTPDPHGFEDLRAAAPKLQGPVVVIARHSGETSGRFEVAAVAARLFPAARHFVRKVIAENIVAASHFHFAPYKTDTVRRLSSTVAEFVTPPNRKGLGTSGRIAANDQPVAGVAIWLPDQGNDLVMTLVRLDPDLRREVRAILTQTERTLGSPELVGRGK